MVPVKTELPAHIVGVGSLLPIKRWDRLISAAAQLKEAGLNFLLRIIGDGPQRHSLEVFSEKLGLQDCVQFEGHVDDIASVLSNARFLVHTSDAEGCPNAVLEAMACGRAIVATDVGDISRLVDNNKSGFIVACSDQAALVESMATLIRDNHICCRMGLAAREKAEREFGLDRLVNQTFAAYRECGWSG